MRRGGRPLVVDLFSGAGGLSLGFEQAGFDILASVEYDPIHAAAHAFNFPLTKVLCRNISDLAAEDLLTACREGADAHGLTSWDGQIDVIVGGPPCQGFSMIGKRMADDPRNQLVLDYLRLVTALRPRYFVMENVPGMLTGGPAGLLAQLLQAFDDSGYGVLLPVRLLNARDFGVPQNRARVFLIGAREDQCLPSYPQATVRPVGKRGASLWLESLDLPTGPSVWDAIGDLPDLDSFDVLLRSDEVKLTSRQLEAMERRLSDYARPLRGLNGDSLWMDHPRLWDETVFTSTMRTVHTQLSVNRFRATEPGTTEPISRFYRPRPDGVCNTLRAGTGSEHGAYTSPRPIHPKLPRVISVREAARIHGFPDWFRFHRSKWHGFRQIGNAVSPFVARAVAAELIRALGVEPTKPAAPLKFGPVDLISFKMGEAARYFGADPESIPAPRRRASLVRTMEAVG